jgi:hypothetical protein
MPASPKRTAASPPASSLSSAAVAAIDRELFRNVPHKQSPTPYDLPGMMQSPSIAATLRPRARRESRPLTSIATTTSLPASSHTANRGSHLASPPATRTEDTTFSLPIEIIDTPDLDELGLSPVCSAPTSRPTSPFSTTPVRPLTSEVYIGTSDTGRFSSAGFGTSTTHRRRQTRITRGKKRVKIFGNFQRCLQ